MPALLRIVRLGRFAHAALTAQEPARAIAVFERSGYVETPAGIACIGVVAIGNGPLNALATSFPAGLAVGDKMNFDLASATLWAPRPAPRWNQDAIAAALARLRDAVRDCLPAQGFGYILAAAAQRPPAVEALARWIAVCGGQAAVPPIDPPDLCAGLIGLGPGLTPAGDDLLGGALCALRAANLPAVAQTLAAWVRPRALAGTSRISRAHLDCAAHGECSETINDAILALLSGDLPDLQRIDAIGHTSGWDALAGVVLTFSALQES